MLNLQQFKRKESKYSLPYSERNVITRSREDIENALPMGGPCNEHKIAIAFGPFISMLSEIENTCEINVIKNGTSVIYAADQECWFPLVASIVSMCDVFQALAATHGWPDKTNGMRMLAKKIDIQTILFQADIDAARITLDWMCASIRLVSPDQFGEATIGIRIREELQSKSMLTDVRAAHAH